MFTSDDLVSLTLLSVTASGSAALQILQQKREPFGDLLASIGPDRDLAEEDSLDLGPFQHVHSLRAGLLSIGGMGPTRVSKLLARKRPRLVPIFDLVVAATLTNGTGRLWRPLHAALQADGGSLHERLLALRFDAGLPEAVSALRVLDVLAWMDGKGYSARLASSDSTDQPDPAEVEAAERAAEISSD